MVVQRCVPRTPEFPFDRIPEGFVLSKPVQQHSYDEQIIYELKKEGHLIITRKRDGYKLFVLISKTGVIRIFTSGLREINDMRLDHLKKELRRKRVPHASFLAGEGIMLKGDSVQDRAKVTTVIKSDFENAMAAQEEYGPLKFMPFSTIFWKGEESLSRPYAANIMLIEKYFSGATNAVCFPVQALNCSYDEAKKLVRKNAWEGLVLYDARTGGSFRLDGKACERPEGCYKWKPLFEDDFIVREWVPSPNDPQRVRDLLLRQIDPKTHREFDCGKLGSFSRAMREKLRTIKYPIVVQVEFEARTPKGKLVNKVFKDIRTDKPVHECVAPKQFPEALYLR